MTYMASLGYIQRANFLAGVNGCNPLAAYAVFDAITEGGGEYASPAQLTEKLRAWKAPEGLESFKGDLLKSSVRKYSAYGFFLFLIALVLDLIVESGANAWL